METETEEAAAVDDSKPAEVPTDDGGSDKVSQPTDMETETAAVAAVSDAPVAMESTDSPAATEPSPAVAAQNGIAEPVATAAPASEAGKPQAPKTLAAKPPQKEEWELMEIPDSWRPRPLLSVRPCKRTMVAAPFVVSGCRIHQLMAVTSHTPAS